MFDDVVKEVHDLLSRLPAKHCSLVPTWILKKTADIVAPPLCCMSEHEQYECHNLTDISSTNQIVIYSYNCSFCQVMAMLGGLVDKEEVGSLSI